MVFEGFVLFESNDDGWGKYTPKPEVDGSKNENMTLKLTFLFFHRFMADAGRVFRPLCVSVSTVRFPSGEEEGTRPFVMGIPNAHVDI